MPFVRTLLILCSFSLIISCASSESNKKQKASDSDNVSAKEDTTNPTPPTPQGPGLAPGQSRIEAKVIVWSSRDIMNVRVQSVKGYGSSTPPIAKGDTLAIHAKMYNLQDHQFDIDSVSTFVIKKSKAMSSSSESRHSWSYVPNAD